MSKEDIVVDGQLDEKVWQQAETVTNFIQLEPSEGTPSSRNTEIRVIFGENGLYIGAHMFDEPESVESALGRRDEYNRADWLLISIDSYLNRRNAYTFGISAAGVQLDGQRTSTDIMGFEDNGTGAAPELPPGLDVSWDAIWYSAVRINEDGWVAEIRIPYSMLRFPEAETQTWGIHFTRRIARLGEVSEWPMIPRTERTNLVANFNRIIEINELKPRKNIQIRPYVLTSLNTSESKSIPGKTSYETRFDAGGDVKIGLGPNVTFDMTVNPDFGQIESDPAVLNLTAFETIYPEKRQFFIEGVDIFEFSIGPGTMFYSRRIGNNNPIIGAAKLSGRTEGKLAFGLLAASTGENFDPANNYGLARLSQQLGNFSSIGGMASVLVNSSEDEDGRLKSVAGGIDWDFRNKNNKYGISGMTAFTHRDPGINGVKAASGYSGRLELSKRQGTLNGLFALLFYSDRFNPNDIGQLQESNFYEIMTRWNYEINHGKPFGIFQRATTGLFALQRYSFDNWLDLGDMVEIETEWTTKSFSIISLGADMTKLFGGYDIYETRGLGPWMRPSDLRFFIEYSTDQRKNWKLTPSFDYEVIGKNGLELALRLQGNWNIGTSFTLSGGISGESENKVPAWASNESFMIENGTVHVGQHSMPPDQITPLEYIPFSSNTQLISRFSNITPYHDNLYYIPVFGKRDTKALDFTLRSSFSFSPDLSLQFYGQFFLAKGIYKDFEILINSDELVFAENYPKQLDFSLKSLVTNLVMRWEYLPGSTLYVVWSHGRNKDDYISPLPPRGDSPYHRSFGRQVSDMFDIFPEHAFIVKLSYTFL
ncbi:MAG TPA: DUF5916 domain-containing protein [Bacteroidales bacterium]|nr:DUF5916 domain-containing protein [Bacteroidales bacterium]